MNLQKGFFVLFISYSRSKLITLNCIQIKKRLKKWFKRVAYFSLFSILLFFILNFLFPFKVNVSYSKLIYDKDGNLIHAYLSKDEQWRMFIELNEITPELKKAIIQKEDQYFYYHPGINPISIVRAIWKNSTSGKRTSGASTITMQVVRMLNRKERSYSNKIIEMFNALQLELNYSKEEILQLYLNKVPYGGNVEGVKAASYIYFDKHPNVLSLSECVALAIIPEDPLDLTPGKNNKAIQIKKNEWLLKFKKQGIFENDAIELAISEPFEYVRHQTPRFAPHFARRLKNEFGNNIHSTLDLSLQNQLEKLSKNYSRYLSSFDIHNLSCLLIQNDSNLVRAYIGSPDFFDNQYGGQVDGVRAIRSPGSTLKPFLYGLSFDLGQLTPMSIVNDVPTSFGQYEPENYDGNFQGEVTVTKALSESLNVPAVKVLDQLGKGEFTDKLGALGFKSIYEKKNELGLSLILGGCGVTLEELAGMYSAFARHGEFQTLNFTSESFAQDSNPVLSSSACFMISDILKKVTRPDLASEWQNTEDIPTVAWKTGTSYGRRDAWSIGYNDEYTVAVWVGNFSGKGIPELSGAQMAGPLFFDIFNFISKRQNEHWHIPNDNLNFRTVCSISGKLPGHYCSNFTDDLFIPGVSSYTECSHVKEVLINSDSTVSYCASCLPDDGYVKALYPNLHPEIVSWHDKRGINYLKIPEHSLECEEKFEGKGPVIISPIAGLEYFVNIQDSTEIMLQAQVSSDIKNLFWYVNDKFVKQIPSNEKLFIRPPLGKVKISCSDDKGMNTDIFVEVREANF
ncbi:MAG: penicillin-binding protein 1C [Bacteroidota bacterium]